MKSFNLQDPNTAITNYYQSGPIDIKGLCIVDLLMVGTQAVGGYFNYYEIQKYIYCATQPLNV